MADRAVAPNEAQWSPESPTAMLIEEMRREIARQNAKLSAFRVLEAAARDLDEWWGTWLRAQPQVKAREHLVECLAALRAALAGLEEGRQ